jgi:hypothetical protein
VDYGYGKAGVDFLKELHPRARNIITNPSYGNGLGDAFVRQSIWLCRQTGGNVAMLLNVQSLCHPSRTRLFTGTPPAVIYMLDECTCWPYGDPKRVITRSISKQRYCWIVWKYG